MVPSSSPSAPARRNDALDGLRGIAALSVFVFHAWLYTRAQVRAAGADGLLDQAVGELRIGLVLFFVLSGFLLFRPWVAATLGDTRARAARCATYAVHRIGAHRARLLPGDHRLGAAAVAAGRASRACGCRRSSSCRCSSSSRRTRAPTTVMTLDPPMWTLAVEASFYALLPLLGWLALRAPATRARPGDRAARAARRRASSSTRCSPSRTCRR